MAGVAQCSDCGVELVQALPTVTGEEDEFAPDAELVRVPIESASDAVLIQSLLRGAGFSFRVITVAGEWWDDVFVRVGDLDDIKAFLEDYRSTRPMTGEELPLRW